MTYYRYPPKSLLSDYLRSAIGVLVTAGPIIFGQLPTSVLVIFAVLATMFALFGLATLKRHWTRIGVSESELLFVPGGQRLTWSDLEQLNLRYYSTRKEKDKGWMQLTLRGRGRKMRIESACEGFDDIARLAASSARAKGLAIDQVSADNFQILGIAMSPDPAEPRNTRSQ